MSFDGFSSNALRIMDTAAVEAAGAGLQLIDVEHILLALLRERGTVAYNVLWRFDLRYCDALLHYSKQPRREETEREGAPHLTERATLVVVSAKKHANEYGKLVDTEHLLWSVLNDKHWKTRDFFDHFAVDATALRAQIEVAIVRRLEVSVPSGSRSSETIRTSRSPSRELDSFSDESIKAIVLAEEESRKMGHHFIGSEQLLLALLANEGIAGQEFSRLDLKLQQVRQEVQKVIGRGAGYVFAEMIFTPRTKQIFSTAKTVAARHKSKLVEPEHILLALLDDPENVASTILRNMGVNLSKLETKILNSIKKRGKDV